MKPFIKISALCISVILAACTRQFDAVERLPLIFPDYANLGNNDRWITIQDYQTENWNDLVQLWKYFNKHLVHVIRHVNPDKLDNEWITALGNKVPLRVMIVDYLRHVELHLGEIDELRQ